MANICCVTRDVLESSSSLSGFIPYRGRLSREDVATLVETFEFAMSEVPVDVIADVLRCPEGYFAFLIDRSRTGDFDFYKYLNEGFVGNIRISPVNAKAVFPRSLSRGIYSEYAGGEEEDFPSTDMDDDEGATGFMDEEDLSALGIQEQYILTYMRDGSAIPITARGTTIGRSQKTADFVIHGNSNVSRPHAKVYLLNGSPMLHDENSKNGTFVKGVRVRPDRDVKLSIGDVVMLADEKFIVGKSS